MAPKQLCDISGVDSNNYEEVVNFLDSTFGDDVAHKQYTILKFIKIAKGGRDKFDIRNSSDTNALHVQRLWALNNEYKNYLNTLPDKPRKSDNIDLCDLKRRWGLYRASDNHNDIFLLLTGLYLFIPALRNDYLFVDLETLSEDTINLSRLSKERVNNTMSISVEPRLKEYIGLLPGVINAVKKLKLPNSGLLNRIHKAQEAVFGVRFTLSELRRLHVKNCGDNIVARKELAGKMNHTLNVSIDNYQQNNDSIVIGTLFE